MTDATLTEYLPAADNTDPSIDGPAEITHAHTVAGWIVDDGRPIAEPDEYSVECSCGETFGSWGQARDHAETGH